MTPTQFCNRYDACRTGREYALQFATMVEVWDNCERVDWLFWILEKHAPLEKMQSVKLAIAFAERVLSMVPEGEDRPRIAIETAKAWVAYPTEANARDAAYAADAADAARAAAYAARAAAYAAYAADAADAADAAYAARAAARAAAYAAYAAENCRIFREAITNPFA